MPKTFVENWILGPHETRSPFGTFFFWLVTSKFWESLFLTYILFNAVVKATDTRDKSEEKAQFLRDVGFYACIVFSIEWLIEILAYGVRDFFADRWYIADTVVNIMNWGSYLRDIGFLPRPYSLFFPNIAFLRMLRFLKPLGRIRALTRAKVVVKTVARALGDMAPVLALVGFVVLFFAIVGIYLFGKQGQLLYRCGIAIPEEDATMLYEANGYEPSSRRHILAKNFTINMHAYVEFRETFEAEFNHFRNHTHLSHTTSQREIMKQFRTHLKGKLEWSEEMMDLDHHIGENPQNVTLFGHIPSKICACPSEEELYAVDVCIDPNLVCDDGLCFLSGMPPISDIHGFSNFAQSAMIVIAVFFQKSWSHYMDLTLAISTLYGYLYFMFLVIFGSFCLLNLTVATVGQNYSLVIKETEEKLAILAAKKAEEEKIEAERSLKQKAPTGEDGDEEKPNVFDTKTGYILWLIGLFGIPVLHRLYFKNWYRGRMFILRCVTFNYFFVGWIIDAFIMPSLNKEASEAQRDRDKEWIEGRKAALDEESQRLEKMRENPQIVALCTFLCYPQMKLAIEESQDHHEKVMEKFKADNAEALKDLESAADDLDDQDSSSQPTSSGDGDSDEEEDEVAERRKRALEARKKLALRSGQSFFSWFADLVVVANAGTLAMQGFDDRLNKYLHPVGYFASIFFIGEAVAKYVAYGGWGYYLLDDGNRFDFTLVVVPSIGELTTIITGRILGLGADYIYQMLALQAIRVFRIAKLTKHLTGLKKLTRKAFKSQAAVGYAMAVTIVFIVFCSLFGMELFKRSTAFAARRNDFQYFLEAMKAMIEFLFGASYFENLELGYAEQDIIGVLYFLLYFYIANFIVLRMFIALIMDNFQFPESERVNLQIQLFQKQQVLRNDLIDGNANPFPLAEQKDRLRKQNVDEDHLRQFQERWQQVVDDRRAEQGKSKETKKHLWDIIIDAAERNKTTVGGVHADEGTELWRMIMSGKNQVRDGLYWLLEWKYFVYFVASAIVFSVILIQVDPPEAPILDPAVRQLIDRSLLAFFTCEVFAKMFVFGAFSQAQPPYTSIEFPAGKPPFFSSTEEGGWNILDFTFICIMMIDVFPNGISLGGFKTIRLVRIVRPMQKNFSTVKNLVAALINSFVSILHVLNLLVILMLLFGLMGISLFRGRLNSCNDLSAEGFEDCIGTSFGGIPDIECTHVDPDAEACPNALGVFLEQQILVQRVWAPARNNFENIGAASMTLLRLLSQDSLRAIFHSLMDIPRKTELICSGSGELGDDGCPAGQSQYVVAEQPSTNTAPENILFPIVFIFVGSAFISQLVIGVLIDSIRRQSGTALYTEAQREWFATEKTLNSRLRLATKAEPPKDSEYLRGRLYLYEILISEPYDTLMMGIIIINTFWMATEHFPAPQEYHSSKAIVDQCFIGIYTVETIAKLYSFGVITWQEPHEKKYLTKDFARTIQSPYFRDRWNCFDFLVVVMSVLDSWILASVDLSEFKLLRVLRVFRLVKKVKTLQLMLSTLGGALNSILSALFFLAIWIFIFAAIGSDPQMFRHVREGRVISSRWNFETIVNAMMLLFRVATGDSWFDLIYDCAVEEPFCSPPKTEEESPAFHQTHSDCGRGPVAYVFFILFWIGCNYIFLPLFVATLIDYFSEAQTDSASLFTGEECDKFAAVWSEFSNSDTPGTMSIESLRPFIERLQAKQHRCGFRVSSDRERFKMVWARIMTDPTKFPQEGVAIIEKEDQEEMGLEEINRDTIVKGFGHSQRAKKICEYVYAQTRVKQGKEVDFKYCAKVLVVFMQRKTFQDPLSSADLVNRGAALQQFMGMLSKHKQPEYENWKENEKWKALAIHHDMVEPLTKSGGRAAKGSREMLDETNLPKILKAIQIVKLELSPPDVPGQDPLQKPAKPTGAKRAELVRKIDSMQKSFDQIVDDMIDNVLYGGKNLQGIRSEGVVDVLLDRIFEASAAKFAKKEIKKQGPWTAAKLDKKHSHLTKFSDSAKHRDEKHHEEVEFVTSVPRGWLNSQKKRKPRRIKKGEVFEDMTQDTKETLGQLLPPVVPPRSSSLALGQNNVVLDHAVRDMFRTDTWKHVFAQTHAPPPQEPATSLSWRKRYENQVEKQQTGIFSGVFGCSAPRNPPNNA